VKLTGLIMAGGRSTRLGTQEEKPLLLFNDRPLIDYPLAALEGSRSIGEFYVVTSLHTKETESLMKKRHVPVIMAPGKGYVEDLNFVLERLMLGKTLVIPADLPFLKPGDIDWVIGEYEKLGRASLKVVIPIEVFENLGVAPTMVKGGHVPSGINVVDGKDLNENNEALSITKRIELAMNINTLDDLKVSAKVLEEVLNANQQ